MHNHAVHKAETVGIQVLNQANCSLAAATLVRRAGVVGMMLRVERSSTGIHRCLGPRLHSASSVLTCGVICSMLRVEGSCAVVTWLRLRHVLS
jgi:hypothetical protein